MAEDKKPTGAVEGLVKGLMGGAAKLGFRVGRISTAIDALEKVRNDARAQLAKTPNHKLARETEDKLTRAIKDLEDLTVKLADAACGEEQ